MWRAYVPNELFMEVWDYLPPMERVSVSQVCNKWRRISLSTPRLWSRIAFFSGNHPNWCSCHSCRAKWTQSPKYNIYNPTPNASNAGFFEQLLLRSAGLPLDVTLLLGCWCGKSQNTCFELLVPHSTRLSRLHFESGEGANLGRLVRLCGSLPALRTLTAGFDEREFEYLKAPYINAPLRQFPGTPFPVLNQVHVYSASCPNSRFFRATAIPAVQELTLTVVYVDDTERDLSQCPNVSRLNLVMAQFSTKGGPDRIAAEFRKLAGLVARIRMVRLLYIPSALEGYILKDFNDICKNSPLGSGR